MKIKDFYHRWQPSDLAPTVAQQRMFLSDLNAVITHYGGINRGDTLTRSPYTKLLND